MQIIFLREKRCKQREQNWHVRRHCFPNLFEINYVIGVYEFVTHACNRPPRNCVMVHPKILRQPFDCFTHNHQLM